MGVKGFNEIVRKQPIVANQDYKYILCDLSNLVITSLFSTYSKMRDESAITSNFIETEHYKALSTKLILLDVHTQLESIVGGVVKRLREFVNVFFKRFSDLSRVVMITDPSSDYDYSINLTKSNTIQACDLTLLDKWIEINEMEAIDGVLHFNSKKETREKRTQYMSVKPKFTIIDKSNDEVIIESTEHEILDEYTEGELMEIANKLRQSLWFTDKTNLLNLIPMIHNRFIETADERVLILESEAEADPCIKAYYNSNFYGERALVVSADTDYWFLFGEVEMVDVVSVLDDPSHSRNPFQFWSGIFKSISPTFLRMCIARSSALLGNDYTQGLSIININDFESVIAKLFNIGSSFEDIVPRNRTNLYRITNTMTNQVLELPKGDSPLERLQRSFKGIDMAILSQLDNDKVKTSKRFFNGYYETILIYLNFMIYSHTIDLSKRPHDISKLEDLYSRFDEIEF